MPIQQGQTTSVPTNSQVFPGPYSQDLIYEKMPDKVPKATRFTPSAPPMRNGVPLSTEIAETTPVPQATDSVISKQLKKELADLDKATEKNKKYSVGNFRDPATEEQIKLLRDGIAKVQNKNSGWDLSALLSLTDSWTGSNLSRTYKPPETQDEKDRQVLELKMKLLDRLSDYGEKKQYWNFKQKELEEKSEGALSKSLKSNLRQADALKKDRDISQSLSTIATKLISYDQQQGRDPQSIEMAKDTIHNNALRKGMELMQSNPELYPTPRSAYDAALEELDSVFNAQLGFK